MANAQSEMFNTARCFDILAFEEYLKSLRSIDDSIITNLNSTVLTSSFQQNDVENATKCTSLHNQLLGAYESRDKIINTCLAEARTRVSQLKETRDNNDSDLKVKKELKSHQTRLRMIEKELGIEQIIQNRSLKALQERCRRYVNF